MLLLTYLPAGVAVFKPLSVDSSVHYNLDQIFMFGGGG